MRSFSCIDSSASIKSAGDSMLFNSLEFFAFLAIVFSAYWIMKNSRKWQNVLLLVASYVFYGWWDVRFLSLIFLCSLVNFICGKLIYITHNKVVKASALTLCCMICVGALCVFKYYNFFADSLKSILTLVGIKADFVTLNIVLPVGISFFTFQALSYTIDIALGKLKPSKSWVEFFAFIAFFPQLVAGPIERASNLLPQFQKDRSFSYENSLHGLCLMAYGLFKKMVVADTLAMYVDKIFYMPELYATPTCILAAFFFSLQIYCDFSGYSDVARGVAKLFGFELMLNFDRPYLSKSFAEFWRRWHISLSSWFKDYVYIPLGGNRVNVMKWIRNTMIVFLLSGLWHGAAWTFVIWGALHGAFLVVGGLKRKYFDGIDSLMPNWMKILVVDIGVAFAWIFFRAGSFEKLTRFMKSLFAFNFKMTSMGLFGQLGPMTFLFIWIAVGLLILSYLCPRDCKFGSNRQSTFFLLVTIFAITFFAVPSGGEFIYFQF